MQHTPVRTGQIIGCAACGIAGQGLSEYLAIASATPCGGDIIAPGL